MDTDGHGFLSCKDGPNWLVERATGPLRRATRSPLFVRQARAIWFK
jgi:hypothetical protein